MKIIFTAQLYRRCIFHYEVPLDEFFMKVVTINAQGLILNPGSLSSEDFLIWACLIEKGSSYLQLSGPAQI